LINDEGGGVMIMSCSGSCARNHKHNQPSLRNRMHDHSYPYTWNVPFRWPAQNDSNRLTVVRA